jgi:hypothetical protein
VTPVLSGVRSIALMLAALAVAGHPLPATAQQDHHPAYDYPTATRADYVIGCLAANGFKREMLDRCACGIDTIADLMPYDEYEKAETIMSMQQGGLGERGALFRDTPIAKEEMQKLRAAEAEVNLRCR